MKILFMFFFSSYAVAAPATIGLGTGAYFGRYQLQMEWEKPNRRSLATFGYTKDQNIGEIKQIAGAYLWTQDSATYGNFNWIPLMAGFFATYTDHKKYYLQSPSKYKNPAYYDITGLRFGFRFSSELILFRKSGQDFRFLIDGSLLERALIAYANNPSEFNILNGFWSLGFSIRTSF